MAPFQLKGAQIHWISGNAQLDGMPNCDDSLGYDIELRNNGKSIYIEVKGSKGAECDFYMSSNEKQFALNNKLNYRLVFVGKVNCDVAKPTVLPLDFLESNCFTKEEDIQYHIFKSALEKA